MTLGIDWLLLLCPGGDWERIWTKQHVGSTGQFVSTKDFAKARFMTIQWVAHHYKRWACTLQNTDVRFGLVFGGRMLKWFAQKLSHWKFFIPRLILINRSLLLLRSAPSLSLGTHDLCHDPFTKYFCDTKTDWSLGAKSVHFCYLCSDMVDILGNGAGAGNSSLLSNCTWGRRVLSWRRAGGRADGPARAGWPLRAVSLHPGWCMQQCCGAADRSLQYLSHQLRPAYL